MHYVSLIIESLRGRPKLAFWALVLTQAAIWTLVPALFYSAPPGEVPMLLAIGREFMLGSYLGPPLAFWLGEIAFRIGGLTGLYVLAQICIVVAYWAVFTLGRAVVGTRHAVLAVLLMVGISAFAVPSPDFGPAVLAAPFWALALLFYWRGVGEGKRGYWFLLALALGLLLLASYAGAILIVAMAVFTFASGRGRAELRHPEPWIALVLFAIVIAPHAAWLSQGQALVAAGFGDSFVAAGRLEPGFWLLSALIVTHLGLVVLVILASGWPRPKRERAPEIDRPPAGAFARGFVYFFAIVPVAIAVVFVFAAGMLGPLDRVTPLVLLSGLAVVVAAGDRVLLYRERLVSTAWLAFLVAPPVLVVLGLFVLPWIAGIDLKIAQPAAVEARFFAESFQRRTGKPVAYVAGDVRLAPLLALSAPSRPHVYFDWAPQRAPWVSSSDLARHGAILVWPAADNSGAPPAILKALFPAVVPETPRSFARTVQGRLPLIRLGWSMIRPQN
jgi:hypothetical protein